MGQVQSTNFNIILKGIKHEKGTKETRIHTVNYCQQKKVLSVLSCQITILLNKLLINQYSSSNNGTEIGWRMARGIFHHH